METKIKDLQKEIHTLTERRGEIDAKLRDAQAAASDAREALLNGNDNAEAAAQKESTVAMYAKAKEEITAKMGTLQKEFAAAREAEAREQAISRLEKHGKEAGHAGKMYKEYAEETRLLLEGRSRALIEADAAWRKAHEDFKRSFIALAPGMSTRALDREADPDKNEEMRRERDELAQTLRERGVDFGAAMPARYVDYLNYRPAERTGDRDERPFSHLVGVLLDPRRKPSERP